VKSEKLEVTRGAGMSSATWSMRMRTFEQFKAILAAAIIKALDRDGLSVRAAHSRTGIAAARLLAHP